VRKTPYSWLQLGGTLNRAGNRHQECVNAQGRGAGQPRCNSRSGGRHRPAAQRDPKLSAHGHAAGSGVVIPDYCTFRTSNAWRAPASVFGRATDWFQLQLLFRACSRVGYAAVPRIGENARPALGTAKLRLRRRRCSTCNWRPAPEAGRAEDSAIARQSDFLGNESAMMDRRAAPDPLPSGSTTRRRTERTSPANSNSCPLTIKQRDTGFHWPCRPARKNRQFGRLLRAVPGSAAGPEYQYACRLRFLAVSTASGLQVVQKLCFELTVAGIERHQLRFQSAVMAAWTGELVQRSCAAAGAGWYNRLRRARRTSWLSAPALRSAAVYVG
jgi:hypothetical protein